MMNQQGVDMQQQQRFSALLDSEYDYTRPRRGQVLYGEVLSIGENEVIVDLGGKRDGIVRRRDLELLDDAYRTSLQIGERVPVYVLSVADPQGELVVSLNLGLTRQDWLRAQDLLESGGVCQAEVIDVNRGGIIVQFGHLRGFVPNSHLTSVPRGVRGARRQQVQQDMLGQTLSLTFIEVDQRRRRLVLSERAADWRRRQQLLEELMEGAIRSGVVRNLVKFGAFVDLGGIDGLIHISELDWKYVNHPNEVLSVGDEVEVYVLSVDRKQERVGLSRKRVLPDPWTLVTGELHVDQVVEGTVTSLTDFGMFVDLGRGVEGLVHVSEISGGKVAYADLEPGSPIQVCVLEIDRWKRRIALSLRGITQEVAPPAVEDAVPVLVGIG
jgi:small subunit ribosomal protein S1